MTRSCSHLVHTAFPIDSSVKWHWWLLRLCRSGRKFKTDKNHPKFSKDLKNLKKSEPNLMMTSNLKGVLNHVKLSLRHCRSDSDAASLSEWIIITPSITSLRSLTATCTAIIISLIALVWHTSSGSVLFRVTPISFVLQSLVLGNNLNIRRCHGIQMDSSYSTWTSPFIRYLIIPSASLSLS